MFVWSDPLVSPEMAADATAKARLERLLGELDKSAETPAGENVDGGDYDGDEYSSMSDVTESDADEGRASRRSESQAGGVYSGRLGQKVAARCAKLEERISSLVEENARKDGKMNAALAAKEREFGVERAKMLEAVSLLKNKQTELERLAPPLREAVFQAKEQLRNVVCSQERLRELQGKSPGELSLGDFATLRVHQETASLRAELDTTRVERDSLSDKATRFEQDNTRLSREVQRATAFVTQTTAEIESERAALESRASRLARELEDAMVKVEVLSAKGAMYDEVASSVDRAGKRAAEAEKDLAVAKGAETSARRERDALASQLASRHHQVELLTQDKAYLSREVEDARDRDRKHEDEEDRLREKVRVLRVARDDLREKVLNGHAEMRSTHEERLDLEVTRLQAKANDDLERLREEHSAHRDREIRALRDLRDAAVADASALRSELSELRAGYDDALGTLRQTQKAADVAHAEITGQLRMKSMELERVSLLHGESQSIAKVLRLECEMLTKKVRLLEGQYLNLEGVASRRTQEHAARGAEMSARLEHYENLERELDDAVMNAASDLDVVKSTDSVAGALGALGSSVPASLRRRLAQNAALGKRCNDLERQVRAATESKDAKASEIEGLLQRVKRAESKVSDNNQPYAYLVERISATEVEADEATRREKLAVGELDNARRAARKARDEAGALRVDLQRTMDERSELNTIKSMLQGTARVGPGPVGTKTARKTVRA